ncbi:hypothetical protein TrVFT333_001773 [Trichoderma virens FT-333]|nr:hypothetical protein TrVFT333_001773 [Trichoderma virens FT-333]
MGAISSRTYFHPNKAGRYPVLMRLGIYGRAFRIGAIFDDADRETSEKREDTWFQGDRQHLHPYWRFSKNAASASPSVWVPRGYVVVLVDGRGVGNVPGKSNPYSKQKTRDYYDAIEWAAKQPWSDGISAATGASYNATTQWHVAALHPPSLKAIASISADGDIHDLSYPGGIFLEATVAGGGMNWCCRSSSPTLRLKIMLGEGPLFANFPSIDIPVLAAVSMASTIHPRSGFEASSLSSRVKRLMDAVYPGYMYKDFQPDLEAFFDQYLKGKRLSEEPPTARTVPRTGDGGRQWRTRRPGLFPTPNIASAVGSRNAMAVLESAPGEEDLELVGHFWATLWVSSTTSDADVFVALRVMDGD